jgi:hypothetical protein
MIQAVPGDHELVLDGALAPQEGMAHACVVFSGRPILKIHVQCVLKGEKNATQPWPTPSCGARLNKQLVVFVPNVISDSTQP